MWRLLLAALLLVALAGCGPPAPLPTPVPPPTPTAEAAPPPAPPPTPTAEAAPPPAPPLPASAEAPTATPAGAPAPQNPGRGAGLTADAVLSAFRAAGLPIGEVTEFPAQPPRTPQNGDPGPYLTKVTWHDSRLPAPAHPVLIEVSDGGGVEVYADTDTAQAHADNLQNNGGIFSSQGETDYVHGPVLVRLAHDLPPGPLAAYKHVLDGLP